MGKTDTKGYEKNRTLKKFLYGEKMESIKTKVMSGLIWTFGERIADKIATFGGLGMDIYVDNDRYKADYSSKRFLPLKTN